MFRTIITWVLTPLLALALLPSFVHLARAVHQGNVMDWIGQTGWVVKAGYGLLLGLILLSIHLRRRPFNRRWLAERPFVRFWSRFLEAGEPRSEFRHQGMIWRIEAETGARRGQPDSPPPFVVSGPYCPRCGHLTEPAGDSEHCPACGFERTARNRSVVLARLNALAASGWEMALRERGRQRA